MTTPPAPRHWAEAFAREGAPSLLKVLRTRLWSRLCLLPRSSQSQTSRFYATRPHTPLPVGRLQTPGTPGPPTPARRRAPTLDGAGRSRTRSKGRKRAPDPVPGDRWHGTGECPLARSACGGMNLTGTDRPAGKTRSRNPQFEDFFRCSTDVKSEKLPRLRMSYSAIVCPASLWHLRIT